MVRRRSPDDRALTGSTGLRAGGVTACLAGELVILHSIYSPAPWGRWCVRAQTVASESQPEALLASVYGSESFTEPNGVGSLSAVSATAVHGGRGPFDARNNPTGHARAETVDVNCFMGQRRQGGRTSTSRAKALWLDWAGGLCRFAVEGIDSVVDAALGCGSQCP